MVSGTSTSTLSQVNRAPQATDIFNSCYQSVCVGLYCNNSILPTEGAGAGTGAGAGAGAGADAGAEGGTLLLTVICFIRRYFSFK